MPTPSRPRSALAARRAGFTIIELVMVIVILAVLAAVAVPRFVDLRDDARTATIEAVYGALNSVVQMAHAKWIAQGGGPSVALESATVSVNPSGWPANGAVLPMTDAACLQLWQDILQEAPDVSAGYTPGAAGWGAVGAGALCGFIHQPDTGPVRWIRYDTTTGVLELITV